ncbi:MAG: hypothetical protein J0I20_07360 [Chloroflexi bacterium]|nr:hypothetical protein [Chloroflexota bacterium]OJV95243.1 MAG: hypothetical protein BGO39_24870 [Chloroflexi bacterium 54-19]
MTTRADFLSGVRVELQDPGPTNYTWSDALLQAILKDGLAQLALDLPPLKEIILAAVVGQRDYILLPGTLALGSGGIAEVQFPVGFVVPEGKTGPQYAGATYLAASDFQPFEQRWELIAGAGDSNILRFRYALAQTGNIIVRAFTVYTAPANDAATLDVNGRDEVALKWAVCARALNWLEETRGKRQGSRVVEGQSPGDYYTRLYEAAIRARRKARGIVSGKVVVNG